MFTKRKFVYIIIFVFTVQFSIVNHKIAFADVQQSNSKIINQASVKSTPYKISKHKYISNGVTIYYPQIMNFSDTKRLEAINKVIKANALRGLKYYSYLHNRNQYTVNIDYSIKLQSTDLLSIEYSGIGNAKGAAHPSYLYYTSNININKATAIRLKDIVHIDKKFVRLFISNKFMPLTNGLESAKTEFGTDDYLLKALSSSDYPVGSSPKPDYSTFSYFTKDYLVISIAVSHAERDHAEYKIKYSDLKGYINTKNEVWKNLKI